ncbi:MAG TPA: glycosyltransferase [Candidatus Binatia bacterium]|jgi:cellulose synthase (UDP-forming)
MLDTVKNWLEDIRGKKAYHRYLELEDRSRRIQTQIFSLLGIVASLAYLAWILTVLNFGNWWLSVPFFLSEVAGLLIFVFFSVITRYPRYHKPEGLPVERDFSVDILITTCGEPLAIVAETVRAAVAINHSNKKVYLSDDAANPELKTLAEKIGAHYLSRQTREDAKAGNLNFALAHSSGELVLTLDADQIAEKEIVQRIIGYFKYAYIGFVQTKQVFKVPEGDPFCNTDPIFYNVMQPGKDSDNAAFSCGSGVMYRRAALASIGGFSTWNLVEDLHTSMLLHAKGWRSVYHNYPLSIGTAPMDIWSVYKQRQQWAADSLRIFLWNNPFKVSGLSLKQKFQYAHIGLVYLFAGFIMPFFYLIPLLSLFSGKAVIETSFWIYTLYRAPSFMFTAYTYKLASYPSPYYQAINTWLGYFPAFMYGTWVALRSRNSKPTYKVNRKVRARTSLASDIVGIVPQFGLIVSSVVAVAYGFYYRTGDLDTLVVSGVWALMTIDKLHWICKAPFSVRFGQGKVLKPSLPLEGVSVSER